MEEDDLRYLGIHLKTDFNKDNKYHKAILRYQLEKKIADKLKEILNYKEAVDLETIKQIKQQITDILMKNKRKIKASLKDFKYFTKVADDYTEIEKKYKLQEQKLKQTNDFIQKILDLNGTDNLISKQNISKDTSQFIEAFNNWFEGLTKNGLLDKIRETLSKEKSIKIDKLKLKATSDEIIDYMIKIIVAYFEIDYNYDDKIYSVMKLLLNLKTEEIKKYDTQAFVKFGSYCADANVVNVSRFIAGPIVN